MESLNDLRFGCTFFCVVMFALLAGCQTPGGMHNALSHPLKVKETWAGRLSGKTTPLDVTKDAERVDPIEQELALARSLEQQGKTAEAIYTYSSILAKEEKRADAHHRLAVLHDKRGNFQASEEHYQKALELDPKNAELLCDRGFSCLLQGRIEDAQSQLKKALKRKPNMSRAHNNLGILLAQQGHVDRALVEFAAAGCSHAEARTNLAYALTVVGKVTEAQYHLEIARQADTSLIPAGKLNDTLSQITHTNVAGLNSQQITTVEESTKQTVNESIKVPPTTNQLQQLATSQPNTAQCRVTPKSQLNDSQITEFGDVFTTSTDVEPVNSVQPSKHKQRQPEQAGSQLTLLPQQTLGFGNTFDSRRQGIDSTPTPLSAEQPIGHCQPIRIESEAGKHDHHREQSDNELVFKL